MDHLNTQTVFLPGTLCDEELFGHQVRALEALNVGTCTLPIIGGDTVEACAELLLKKAPAAFNLVGFSQGAVIALEMLRRAPDRVLKLVLMSANPGGTTPEQRRSWEALRTLAYAEGLEKVIDAYYQATFSQARSAALRETLQRMANGMGVDMFDQQLRILESRRDSRDTLRRVACPTLVLAGEHDPITPVTMHQEIASLMPNAALQVIWGSGHYPPLEQPAAVSEQLTDWLLI